MPIYFNTDTQKYWNNIRNLVRNGLASSELKTGTILYDNCDSNTGFAYQVAGIDKHFNPTLYAQGYTHSITLTEVFITDYLYADAPQAFLVTTREVPAGEYKFTIPDYDTTYGGNADYYFTTTVPIPSGSQLVFYWPGTNIPQNVSAYASPQSTTALEGLSELPLTTTPTGSVDDVKNLCVIGGPKSEEGSSDYGTVNHIRRARYGSNNYLQSGIRQYLNSDQQSNTWWQPQTIFDRPYQERGENGKLAKLNSDFVNVLVAPQINSITNKYFEVPSLDGTTFSLETEYTITTDKVFLLAPYEIGIESYTTIGTPLDYYVDNRSRIKIRKPDLITRMWYLRTPYAIRDEIIQGVNVNGELSQYHAGKPGLQYGIVSACVIQ